MVGVTRTPATVTVPRTAPRTSTGSRRRSDRRSATIPARIPTNATTATGAFATSRTCHGATARTRPPTVGPTASPTRPAVEITVSARTRRSSASNRRNARAIAPGVVIAAATPVRRADDDQPLDRGHGECRDAHPGEQDESDEHDPAATEPVGDGAEQEHQAAERQRVRAGDPLQRGRRCAEVAPDGRQGHGEDRVVEHLEQEHGGQPARAIQASADVAVTPDG